jgi:hypothetical protein
MFIFLVGLGFLLVSAVGGSASSNCLAPTISGYNSEVVACWQFFWLDLEVLAHINCLEIGNIKPIKISLCPYFHLELPGMWHSHTSGAWYQF